LRSLNTLRRGEARPVFWPYLYSDVFTYLVWPDAYYDAFLAYGPDFWPGPYDSDWSDDQYVRWHL
jgi:hypothetical protein